jgi:hypothetical protein
MRRLMLMTVAVLAGSITAAEARPDTLKMSCSQASALVQARGGVVLDTGPSVYDRYVRAQNFCASSEGLTPSWVMTADNPQCFVGYRCETEWPPSHDR